MSLKYAQVGSINRGYQQDSNQGNQGYQGMEQVDQPVARPMSQVDSGDAPF